MENNNQEILSQESQSIQPALPTKDKNIFKYLFIVSIILLLGVIVGFYFLFNNKIKQLENKQIVETTPVVEEISTTPTKTEIIPTTVPTIKSTESTLVEKDANNNLYTNNKFGFSLIIPKAVKQASCSKESDSYRLDETKSIEETPLSFFEDGDTIYLAVKYFYNLTGEQKMSQGYSNYSGCEKNITTFKQIENRKMYVNPVHLKIYITNIKDDNDLEQFIKSKYGSGCKLGKKTLDSNGIYDIEILGDGKDLGESKCPINFIIEPKLSPNKDKLIIFELGQACPLYKDFVNYGCYDEEIINSLKFN